MTRGDIAIASPPGSYGQPRPVLVVHSDLFVLNSVTVLPLTSRLHDAPMVRPEIRPDGENGLRLASQVMVDKAVTLPRDKIGQPIGRLADEQMRTVEDAMIAFLGLTVAR